ncbi:hypothetical protein HYU90_01825 [Candidatus Collierbacteria bacterium]|nr:hypothetical protein [Candidatus Collierbacteria bacterium]
MVKRLFHRGFSWHAIKRGFIAHWPLFLLIGIIAILTFLNYQSNTQLTGWDNLQSDLNLDLNLHRAIFSVWQEYQSLGLLAGMAHATDITRLLFLSFLSRIGIPQTILRYSWHFFALTLGPIFTYFLLHHIFLKPKFDPQTKKIASFLGALFYLLNLATLQSFFTPYESFSSFYAFFPLIILATTLYFEKASTKHYLLLLTVLLISSPAFYVQTLFIVLSLCLLPIILGHLGHGKKKILILLLTLLATQSYWLLPQIFFVLTKAGDVSSSHVNLLSTIETYHRNLQYSNLRDLALLRGFWFSFTDLAGGGKFDYLLTPWRSHLANPTIYLIGYLSFALVLTGIVYSLKKKIPYAKSILGIFVICYFFLLGGGLLINSQIPLIGELFRSPFTKFCIPLSLTYSVFFSVGCIFLLDLFSFLHSRLTYILTLFTVSLALVIYMTPAFTGNLISPSMRVKIPNEYFQLFDFFSQQDPATRIANFPQYTFWGWNYYDWGYRGSGFLWYGIKQPILDRAFDVWDRGGEKYYEEMSTALYSQNQNEFENIVDKYAINWLLIDKNVIAPGPDVDLGLAKLQKFLDNSDKFTLTFTAGEKILVYKNVSASGGKNFLSLSPSLRSGFAPVIANEVKQSIQIIPGSPREYARDDEEVHPFASSSPRPQPTQIKDNSLTLNSYLPNFVNSFLTIPNYLVAEKLVPTAISYKKTTKGLTLKFESLLPTITIGDKQIKLTAPATHLDFPLTTTQSGFVLAVNDQFFEVQLPEELAYQATYYPVTTTYLPTQTKLRISLYANSSFYTLDLTTAFATATPSQCFTSKPNRRIEKIISQNTISLFGTDVVGCLSAPIPQGNDTNLLILLNLTYSSPTNTPANASISTLGLSSLNSPQPLIAKKDPTFARFYAKPIFQPLQVNLILEANETKSTQEIDYQNISVDYLPLLAESDITLTGNPTQKIPLNNAKPVTTNNITVSLPIIDSSLTVNSNPTHNLLSPEPVNCDNFNHDKFDKQTTAEGTLYTATNANSCDSLNLRHLPHDTNYAILIDQQALEGLPTTVCLENYSTRRCDVFERLINGKQVIVQPISNPDESAGYTLHLFNQSFGNRPTKNLTRSITVAPYPLQFLKGITFEATNFPSTQRGEGGTSTLGGEVSSTHPAEFLYTADISSDGDPAGSSSEVISLYQTRSTYWKALEVSEANAKLPLWPLILKLPLLYLNNNQLPQVTMNNANDSWHNNWLVPPGPHHLIIFYLPQYLEFLGLIILPLPILILSVIASVRAWRSRSKKSPV